MGVNTKSFDSASDMITFSRASGAYGLTKVSYGSELVTNGTFDTDTTGSTPNTWETNSANASLIKQADGTALFTSASFAYARISNEDRPVLPVGVYWVSFEISETQGSLSNVHVGIGAVGNTISGDGTYGYAYVSSSEQAYELQIRPNSGGTGSFKIDNISVKEVTYNSSDPSATLKLIYHPNDVPRIEYNVDGSAKGILIEEARTNSYKYSEDFSNSEWIGSSGTISSINAITSPDGNSTGNLVITGVNTPFSRRQNGLGVDSIISFYAKAQEYSFVFANNDNGAGWVCFDLATESIALGNNGFSGEMTAVGNGWYRCVATFPMLIAGHNVHMAIGVRENFGGTYTASSANGTSGAYIWGAQMEAGSFATSYIKTENVTATRALDTPQINVSNFINKSAGTFLATFNYSDPTNVDANYVLGGTSNARVFYNNGGTSYWSSFDGSAPTALGALDSGEVYKLAVAIKTDSNISTAKNGDIVANSTSGTALMTNIEATPLLSIGGGSANQKLNGHIKSITYYPRRLTNAQIQRLTQPISTPTLSLTFDGQATSFTEDSIHG
jgi:hypothetical protein